MPPLSSPVDRELIGVCKQSMLALRQQLQQYIDELHADKRIEDLKPYIITAANEFCDCRTQCSTTTSDINSWKHESQRAFDNFHNKILASSKRNDSQDQNLGDSVSVPIDEGEITNEVITAENACDLPVDNSESANCEEQSSSVSCFVLNDDNHATASITSAVSEHSTAVTNVHEHWPRCSTSDHSVVPLTAIKQETSDEMNSLEETMMSSASEENVESVFLLHDPVAGTSNTYLESLMANVKEKHWKKNSSRRKIVTQHQSKRNKGSLVKHYCPYCPWVKNSGMTMLMVDHVNQLHSEFITPVESVPYRSKWQYRCPHCTPHRIFPSLSTIERHYRELHISNPERFYCPHCSHSTKRLTNLNVHLSRAHPEFHTNSSGE